MQRVPHSILVSWLGLGLAYLLLASSVQAQSPEGTYRFWVTTGGDAEPETVAEGLFVLFTEQVDSATISGELRSETWRQSRWLTQLGRVAANACFGFSASQSEVQGREFYGGIIPFGLTRWTLQNGEVAIRVYQSPDASQELRGALGPDGLVGRAHQRDFDGRGPVEWLPFRAERIGPATSTACGDALRLGQAGERRRLSGNPDG